LFTYVSCPFWLTFLLFISLGIIRTTGRSEGKNLSNIRLEIKYIILILGVDHFPPPLLVMAVTLK
jgi:hypothetical protein